MAAAAPWVAFDDVARRIGSAARSTRARMDLARGRGAAWTLRGARTTWRGARWARADGVADGRGPEVAEGAGADGAGADGVATDGVGVRLEPRPTVRVVPVERGGRDGHRDGVPGVVVEGQPDARDDAVGAGVQHRADGLAAGAGDDDEQAGDRQEDEGEERSLVVGAHVSLPPRWAPDSACPTSVPGQKGAAPIPETE